MSRPSKKFHGGPEIRTHIPPNSKRLRGLRPQPKIHVDVTSPDRSRVPTLSPSELREAFELCTTLYRQNPSMTLSQCRHEAMRIIARKQDHKPGNLAQPLAVNQDTGRDSAPAASLRPPNGCFEPPEIRSGIRSLSVPSDSTGSGAVNDALVTRSEGVDQGSPHPVPDRR